MASRYQLSAGKKGLYYSECPAITMTTKENEMKDLTSPRLASSKGCLSNRRRARVVAALICLSVIAAIILALFFAGVFDSAPDLPDVMEGEATFTSDEGKEENFHVMIDYKKKIIQLASIDVPVLGKASFGRRLMAYAENGTANGTRTNMTKIIIQDYNTNRKYFIVPRPNVNSTTKCIYTKLEGEMIPQHLLKYATLKSESVEGNTTHGLFQVDNETDVDVYKAKGRNGKIYEVYVHLPNGRLHLRSREREMNFTEFRKLHCYRYNEENNTLDESFYKSNDSKFYETPDNSELPSMNETVRETISKLTKESNVSEIDLTQHTPDSVVRRRRRDLGSRPNGKLDWWYGNWCGAYQGGYERYPKPSCNRLCFQSTRYISPGCRECLPPKDGLDAACMEHDRCLIEAGQGPWWCQPVGNRCSCDFRFVWKAASYILACPNGQCRSNAAQAFIAFHFLSCWFPVKICFPWISISCGGCKICCLRIRIYLHCFTFKMCAPFGSGKIPF